MNMLLADCVDDVELSCFIVLVGKSLAIRDKASHVFSVRYQEGVNELTDIPRALQACNAVRLDSRL